MQLATGVVVHATYTSFDPLHSVILPGLCICGLFVCMALACAILDAPNSSTYRDPTTAEVVSNILLIFVVPFIITTLFTFAMNPEHHLAPPQDSISSVQAVADHYKITNMGDNETHCIDRPLAKMPSYACDITFYRNDGGSTEYTGVAQYNASNKTVTIYQRTAKGTLKEYRQQ